jgi:hypothetical protein
LKNLAAVADKSPQTSNPFETNIKAKQHHHRWCNSTLASIAEQRYTLIPFTIGHDQDIQAAHQFSFFECLSQYIPTN